MLTWPITHITVYVIHTDLDRVCLIVYTFGDFRLILRGGWVGVGGWVGKMREKIR